MDVAHEMRQFAYCPYSQFSVGAALLCPDGTVFKGIGYMYLRTIRIKDYIYI